MLGEVAQIASLINGIIPGFVLVLVRLSVILFFLPGLSAQVLPMKIKVALLIWLSVLIAPAVDAAAGDSLISFASLMGEAVVGLFLGFITRLTLYALNIVGAVAAQSLSLSQIFGAALTEESNTTLTMLLTLAGATLFLTAGLHLVAVDLLVASYTVLPPGDVFTSPAIGEMARRAVQGAGYAFALAIALALPFILLNLAYNVLLGVMNKAMPQLMVTFIGLPAITFSGMILLIAVSGETLTIWFEVTVERLGRVFQ